ncbi:HlyD family secretion protein [Yersinia nurmii]|uniref:HlyD family secretion protein n=1 Tax=Yersinia nurmii TaxID=685706 RepID=A0AAW7K1P9_9GAMM|nr:HlyD family secretion protein [Yersinia nurmii]MDN0089243.1 HlyD family secretion protein [Yersinia nurmii]
MTRESIFRKEVLDNQKARWNGKALLIKGVSPWIVLTVSIAIILMLIALLTLGEYTRRINITGEVITESHAINLFSPQQGFITQSLVSVGQSVKKGQQIYQIDISRVTDSGNVSGKNMASIEKQIIELDNLVQRVKENKLSIAMNLEQQIAQNSHAYQESLKLIEASKKGMAEMQRTLDNYQEYQRKGLISKDQLANQRAIFYQQQNAYQSLYRQSMQENTQLTTLRTEKNIRLADFDNQISQYQYQRIDLQRQLTLAESSGVLVINAPIDGKIESLSVTPGQMVNLGDSLAQLTPKERKQYRLVLWIPTSSAPYVMAGDRINIRYDAFPFEKFGQFSGHIISISAVPASSQEMSTYNNIPKGANRNIGTAYYKTLVAMDDQSLLYQGRQLKLSNGLTAQATIFMEKRPLYKWMFSPFYDMKKSVGGPIHG